MSASRAVKRQPQLEESESDAEMIVTQEEAKPVVHRSDEDHDSDEEVEQSLGSKRRRLSNQPNGKQRAKRSGRHDVDSEEDEDDQQPQKEEDKDPDDNMAEAELQRAIAAFRMPQRNRDADGWVHLANPL